MDQCYAAEDGDLVRLKGLVTLANVEQKIRDGRTVLHLSCRRGHAHVVAWLVGLGVDVNACDPNGFTPLHLATRDLHTCCVQLLLDAGGDASIATNNGRIPLHFAYMSAECTALLIPAHLAGANAVDKDGRTALHYAAQFGTSDICSLLLDAGSMVDAVDNIGFTPLYSTLRQGKRDVSELLLDRGAQLDRVKLDEYLEAIPDWAVSFVARRNACRSSCWAVLELARRRSQIIGGNTRDVVGLISRIVWVSRRDQSWEQTLKSEAGKNDLR